MSEPALFTIASPSDAVWRDQGSKFLAYAKPVTGEGEFSAFVKELKSRWPDATHHCLAARWEPDSIRELAQDDGEPSGTAGLPILNQLRSRNLVNVACVVVRYFGGTKLGKSGLIEAYGTAAASCLDEAPLIAIEKHHQYRIQTSYTEIKLIDYALKKHHGLIRSTSFTDIILYDVALPASTVDLFLSDMERHGKHRIRLEPMGVEWAAK
jgi:uncharacterized YigZ family protein